MKVFTLIAGAVERTVSIKVCIALSSIFTIVSYSLKMTTKLQKSLFLVIVALAVMVQCRSYYPEEVQDEDDGSLELVELVPLRRIPRGVQQGVPQPLPQRRYHQEPTFQQRPNKRYPPQQSNNHHHHHHNRGPPVLMQEQFEPLEVSGSKGEPLVASETGHGGGGHGHDYVDYGAYTGGWGAFGWYSDHPVHTYGH